MERLKIAKRELRSFMSDCLMLRGCQPNEVSACAKIREALALIDEAELMTAQWLLPESIKQKLAQLRAKEVERG